MAGRSSLLLLSGSGGGGPIQDVRVEGRSFVTDAGRFRYRGASAFALASFVASGRLQEAEAFVAWCAARDVRVLRVLSMWNNPVAVLSPVAGRAAMPTVLNLAQKYGCHVEVVALADTKSFTFDHFEHVRALAKISKLLQIANEPDHPTQLPIVADPSYLAQLAVAAKDANPSALVTHGPAHGSDDESLRYAGGDYVTVHAARADGDRGWRWVRHCREIQHNRDGQTASAGSPHMKPAVNDEPNREAPATDKHLALGVMMQMWDVGDTCHLASLRDCLIPTGDDLAAFEARRRGWNLVRNFVGSYSRAGLSGDPIASALLPNQPLGTTPEQAEAIAYYSAINDGSALVVGLGVRSEDHTVWRDDEWTHWLVDSEGEARIYEAARR